MVFITVYTFISTTWYLCCRKSKLTVVNLDHVYQSSTLDWNSYYQLTLYWNVVNTTIDTLHSMISQSIVSRATDSYIDHKLVNSQLSDWLTVSQKNCWLSVDQKSAEVPINGQLRVYILFNIWPWSPLVQMIQNYYNIDRDLYTEHELSSSETAIRWLIKLIL